MSLASYRKRVLSSGNSITEAISLDTKMSQMDYVLNSASRKDVFLNMDESKKIPSIPSDIDTFKRRRFLFLPDCKVYIGDYICHDGFAYVAIDQTTDDKFPQLIGQFCNFDFPIKIGEEERIIDYYPNGQPIKEVTPTYLMKPCAFTTKDYSTIPNSKLNLPEGAMTVFLPYVEDEPMPYINQVIPRDEGEYKVSDILADNIVLFGDGKKRGYWEIRLQRVVNTLHD